MRSRTPVDTADVEEILLGGVRDLDGRTVAEKVGIAPEVVAGFWRTLGLPPVPDDAPNFTGLDAEAMDRAARLVREEGMELESVMSLTRALGHTADRLVVWQVEALTADLEKRYQLDPLTARLLLLDRLPELMPLLEAQLLHAYRRHLASTAGRFAVEFGEARLPEHEATELPLARAVGFADIVSFTRATAGLSASELAQFVQTFEAQTRDVVAAAGGRVVKTIGDAVLFVADDAATGALVALGLAERFTHLDGRPDWTERRAGVERRLGGGQDGWLGPERRRGQDRRTTPDPLGRARVPAPLPAVPSPPVRVSLVWGRVLSRFGDVFGPSVNLAARLADIATPCTVLTDEATADTLCDDPRFVCEPRPQHRLAGVGLVRPFRVSLAPGP